MPTLHQPTQARPHSTRNQPFLLTLSFLALPLIGLNLAGCTAPESTNKSAATSSTIAAMVNSQPITNEELWPIMAEISGEQALEELILSKFLEEIARDFDWTITDADLELELDNLIFTINQSANPQSTPLLIETIRHRRGLGPERFDALLRRNTILRRLLPAIDSPEFKKLVGNEIGQAILKLPEVWNRENIKEITHRSELVVQQREMEKLARSLLEGREVLVMDRSLKWSGE